MVFVDGYPLRGDLRIDALAAVRSGGNRTPDLLARLRDEIQLAISSATGLRMPQIEVELVGVPANWTMEGGEILPDPGTEGTRT
ncbi:4-oxalocrotonate tautomerase [Nocardia rhizosphaerihabitans]|uniref:4-oxalocrotonate tautomerase n=1 Tax=Nocardia rhizosphaerihabitans TaxID=1691570 RepID=UPI00366C0375